MLAKFAEDDRIEQMNAQKRRMKQLEHWRSLLLLLPNVTEHRSLLVVYVFNFYQTL